MRAPNQIVMVQSYAHAVTLSMPVVASCTLKRELKKAPQFIHLMSLLLFASSNKEMAFWQKKYAQ